MTIPVAHSQPLVFELPSDPKCTALLLIDFQGDFCQADQTFLGALGAPATLTAATLGPASAVLEAARKARLTIIHTLEAHNVDLNDLTASKNRRSRPTGEPNQRELAVIGRDDGNGRMLVRGSPCNGLMPAVAFVDGEIAIHKPGKGAFWNTELLARLQEAGVSHLIVSGVTTEVCVQTTLREANDRGFDCLIVEDATASCEPAFKEQALAQMTSFGAIVACSAKSADVIQALETLAARNASITAVPPSPYPTDATTPRLPVIDVSPLVQRLRQPFAAARQAVDVECLRCARAIDEACRRVGFFYVTGHGIGQVPLSSAREFFQLDTTIKMPLRAGAGEGAGYEPSGAQVLDEGRLGEGIDGNDIARGGDQKESYIIGKSAPSQRTDHMERIEGKWPTEEQLPGFKATLLEYHDQCELLLRILLRGVALGLGLAADTFDCFTKDAMTKVRLLRYPPSEDAGYTQAFGCGAHTDWGALTLLAQDQVGGLEVCYEVPGKGPEWIAAPNIPGALLVNVGDMLKLWSLHRYRSAPHRVIKPAQAHAERHSIAVFYNFDFDAPLDPHLLLPNQHLEWDGRVRTAEEYILERVTETYSKRAVSPI